MTDATEAGDTPGGEGRAGGPTSVQIFSSIVRGFRSEGREPSEVRFHRVTEGLYSLEVQLHGEPEPEEIFYFRPEEVEDIEGSIPFGDFSESSEG